MLPALRKVINHTKNDESKRIPAIAMQMYAKTSRNVPKACKFSLSLKHIFPALEYLITYRRRPKIITKAF